MTVVVVGRIVHAGDERGLMMEERCRAIKPTERDRDNGTERTTRVRHGTEGGGADAFGSVGG